MLIIDRVQKCNCYLSVSTLRSQKISGILLVVFLSPSRFFGTVSAVLTWICINHSCLVAVYTLKKSGTPFFFVYKRLSPTFTFHAFVWPSKHQSNLFFSFNISKYIKPYLLWFFFGSNYVFSVVSFSLKSNCLSGTHLLLFQCQKTSFAPRFYISLQY